MTDRSIFCPHEDREALAEDYLARRLSEERAEAFEAHYFACDACFTAVELSAGLHQAVRHPARAPIASRPALARPASVLGVPRIWTWAAAAAVAAMFLLAVPGLRLLRLPGRSPGDAPVLRGALDGFEVSASRNPSELLLEWPAVTGAGQYEVRISSIEGETLWERRTAETRLAVPLDELPAGAGARDLYARVEVLGGLLRPVARSQIIALPFTGDTTP